MTVLSSTAAAVDLDIRKVTTNIGAEISGVAIEEDLDTATVAALRAAINEHKALVFRGADPAGAAGVAGKRWFRRTSRHSAR